MQSLSSNFLTKISMYIANCERDEPDAAASIACKAAQMRVEPKRRHRPAEVGVILISWQISPSKNSCSQRVGHF